MRHIPHETTDCLCGESRTEPAIIRCRDPMTGAIYDYVRCAHCGIERCSPRPVASVIGQFYADDYPAHAIRRKSLGTAAQRLDHAVYWADANRFGVLRPVLRLLLRPVKGRSPLAFRAPTGRRVFEFGAAAGNDLAVFKEAGWDVSGCEPSAHACAVAASRGIVLQNCPAEAAAVSPGGVACVLINHVFEHLHDPVRVLEMIHAALEPGGVLVMGVPNHAGWPARLFGGAWPGYDAPRHLWGFSERNLTDLLRRHGFDIEHVWHQMLGPWSWQVILAGKHAARPVPAWRARWAKVLALPLLAFGALAASTGHGDHLKIVARRR